MIISIIIWYLIGVFVAFLCIGAQNDTNEKDGTKMRWSVFLIMFSYLILLYFILDKIVSIFTFSYTPSLKAFLQLFQKREE